MELAVKSAGAGALVDAGLQRVMARNEISASSKIARAVDDSLGALIDELA